MHSICGTYWKEVSQMIIRNVFSIRPWLFFIAILFALVPQSGLPAKESLELEDLLDISFEELIKIHVATKSEKTMREAPSIVSVITGEEIKNMGARNIIDVLRTVPGFDVTLSPIGTYQINIRGMRSSRHNDKIKIMIDGHSLSALWGSNQALFNTLPIANVRQIELIRGPGSALYGTGAFLGVINIVTRKGGEGPSTIAFEGGSHNTVKPYGVFLHKNGDFRTYLYADYHTTDGHDAIVDSDMFGSGPHTAAPGNTTNKKEYYVAQGDIRYKNLYFSGSFQHSKSQIPIGIAYALTDEDDAQETYAYGELGYVASIDKGNLQIRAFADYAEQDDLLELFSEETAASVFGWTNGESVFGCPYAEYYILGAEISGGYEIIKGADFTAGFSYEYDEQFNSKHYANTNIIGTPLELNDTIYQPMEYLGGMADISENGNWIRDSKRIVYALYGQWFFDIEELFSMKKWTRDFSVTAGIRYDHYDDFGSSLNPRLGIVYAPTEKLFLKGLYGRAFRAPSFKELYAINNPAQIGNEDLDAEKIATTEALVGVNFTKEFTGSLTFFHVSAEDLIQLESPNIQGEPSVFGNIGKMVSSGIELELKMKFDEQKYIFLNATWQDVKDTTHATIRSDEGRVYTQEDFNPGSIPEFYGNIGMNYDINDYIIANVSLNYVGERERSEEKEWDRENLVRADRRDPVKDRALLNASLTFRNLIKATEIQISGFNLFNVDHRDPASENVENDMPMEGAGFMGRLLYSF